jgi:hypothetical protein
MKRVTGRQRLGSCALVDLADSIKQSGLVKDDSQHIQDNLAGWAALGERYQLLADDLGGLGILVLLPEETAEYMYVFLCRILADPNINSWERLVKKGLKREERIRSIKDRKIGEEAVQIGAHDVVKSIFEYMAYSVAPYIASTFPSLAEDDIFSVLLHTDLADASANDEPGQKNSRKRAHPLESQQQSKKKRRTTQVSRTEHSSPHVEELGYPSPPSADEDIENASTSEPASECSNISEAEHGQPSDTSPSTENNDAEQSLNPCPDSGERLQPVQHVQHQPHGFSGNHRDEQHLVNDAFQALNSSTPWLTSRSQAAQPASVDQYYSSGEHVNAEAPLVENNAYQRVPTAQSHSTRFDVSHDSPFSQMQAAPGTGRIPTTDLTEDGESAEYPPNPRLGHVYERRQDHNGDDFPPGHHAYRGMPTDASHLDEIRSDTFNGNPSNQMQGAAPGIERLDQPYPNPSNLMSASNQSRSYDPSIHMRVPPGVQAPFQESYNSRHVQTAVGGMLPQEGNEKHRQTHQGPISSENFANHMVGLSANHNVAQSSRQLSENRLSPLQVPDRNRTSQQYRDNAQIPLPPVSSLLSTIRPAASPGGHTFKNDVDNAYTTQQPLIPTPVLSDSSPLPPLASRLPNDDGPTISEARLRSIDNQSASAFSTTNLVSSENFTRQPSGISADRSAEACLDNLNCQKIDYPLEDIFGNWDQDYPLENMAGNADQDYPDMASNPVEDIFGNWDQDYPLENMANNPVEDIFGNWDQDYPLEDMAGNENQDDPPEDILSN